MREEKAGVGHGTGVQRVYKSETGGKGRKGL
jgi:hypothetical protein